MAAKSGGCFHGDASVTLEGGGRRSMAELRAGDRVLAWAGGVGGALVFSEVLTFLHRDPDAAALFVTLETEAGPRLALTPAHLIFVAEGNCSEGAVPAGLRAAYAGSVRPGQCLLVSAGEPGRLSRVSRVSVGGGRGVYAPLTGRGTLVVDGVAASCYALLERHRLAHLAFAPLRLMQRCTGSTGSSGGRRGLHWYARLLLWLGGKLLDPGSLHPLGGA